MLAPKKAICAHGTPGRLEDAKTACGAEWLASSSAWLATTEWLAFWFLRENDPKLRHEGTGRSAARQAPGEWRPTVARASVDSRVSGPVPTSRNFG